MTDDEREAEVIHITERVTCEVVADFQKTHPRLKSCCTDVGSALLEALPPHLAHIPGVAVKYVVGTWHGTTSSGIDRECSVQPRGDSNKDGSYSSFESKNPPHQWMCIRLNGKNILEFDPTYIQFDETSYWDWPTCIDAVRLSCVRNEGACEFTSKTEEYELRRLQYT